MREYHELLFAAVDEDDLNHLVAGRPVGHATPWMPGVTRTRQNKNQFGVILEWNDGVGRPLGLIADESLFPRLFGRFSQLRSDFSPLSSWLHILTPRFFEAIDGPDRKADLGKTEAAWAALSVAEAQLLGGTPMPNVRIAACFATQSFAIARGLALWPHLSADEIASTHEQTRALLKSSNGVRNPVSLALRPLWEIFSHLSTGSSKASGKPYRRIVDTLSRIREFRSSGSLNEIGFCLEPLYGITPIASRVSEIEQLTPEHRLRLFDEIVSGLPLDESKTTSEENLSLSLLAGYVSTIAAGGAPSLSLAEGHSTKHPSILAWAYAVGSLGEPINWTSSFEGLGRLVVRELLRPIHFDEPPTCDFCFNELKVLADSALADPLVHLRIKQARTISVALFPGTNVTFSIDGQRGERPIRRSTAESIADVRPAPADNFVAALAEALLPYLRDKLTVSRAPTDYRPDKPYRKKRPSGSQETDLPFEGSAKK